MVVLCCECPRRWIFLLFLGGPEQLWSKNVTALAATCTHTPSFFSTVKFWTARGDVMFCLPPWHHKENNQ